MEFSSKLFLPILKEEIRYLNLNNHNYLDILKFITNNDDEGLINYFEEILKEKIKNKKVISKLTNIEKFLILLDLRAVLLGDKLQLINKENINIDLSISSIRDNLIKNINILELIKYVDYSNIQLCLSIPNSLNVENIDQVYKELIKEVKIEDENIQFSLLTEEEKDTIIGSLPANLSQELLKFVDVCQDLSEKIHIIRGNERLGIENVPLRVFDKTMFSFLKSTFGNDLMGFYELQFNMMSKLNVSSDNFMKMSPNECKIFINFYNQDMKRQEEGQRSGGSMPSMPKIPKFN
jgi:hypothetical protein